MPDKPQKISLTELKNNHEKEILLLLQRKGKCLYGEILKELTLSVLEGQKIVFNLQQSGLIRRNEDSRYYELNVTLV